jgi:hypothetical protein
MFFPKRKKGLVDSAKALEDADQNLKRVKSREKEVHEVAESLRIIRQRNHFAEQLQEILGGSTAR